MTQQLNTNLSEFLERPLLSARFEVLKVIGEGAAGIIYLVKDRENNGNEVALKILARDAAFDENTIERFRNEFSLCQKIRHPNIVEAYDFFHLDDSVAFTMEYVHGADLGRIFRDRNVSHQQIELIFSQLLAAVEELHAHAVLHRDLKMENVLVRRDGIVKLSDLGLTKQGARDLTRTGVLLGTAHYFPPEYVREGKYDVRSEIFSLGTMLYELLSGERWLHDMPGNQVIDYLIKNQFSFPLDSLQNVPPKLNLILTKSLQYKPMNRFATISEMRAVLGDKNAATPQITNAKIQAWESSTPPPIVDESTRFARLSGAHIKRKKSFGKRLFFFIWITCSVAVFAVALALLTQPAVLPAAQEKVQPENVAVKVNQTSVKKEAAKPALKSKSLPKGQSPLPGKSR